MPHNPNDWAPLQGILQNILLTQNDGLSEYQLFNILKSPDYKLFTAEALSDPLSLFQSHFILFNALYQLQDKWLSNKTGLLQIHCSCICHSPWQPGKNGINSQDKLRAYYLDWSNLNDTDQSQVEALLDSFWLGLSGLPNQLHNNQMSQDKALEILSLTAPFSAQQLKQQYRKMLHKHHPDKGGEHSQTVNIHKAYERLKVDC